MTSIEKLGKKWKKDPEFRAEYDALEEEFALAAALIDARKQADLTQEEIAERMGTSQTAIARLEGDKGNPSIKTLRRYAEATGTRLKITFEAAPDDQSRP
ncbi:MAG: helix-turn-helix domain-containing protein [Alphaproteobacteria bacterium]|nr:helix-turn-helix domain-containing protein [Alphaproteobacteria bacterium]